MVKFENDCCGCQLPCIGKNCPYDHITVLICDKCGDEVDELYEVDGDQLCADCALESLDKVDPDACDDCE